MQKIILNEYYFRSGGQIEAVNVMKFWDPSVARKQNKVADILRLCQITFRTNIDRMT